MIERSPRTFVTASQALLSRTRCVLPTYHTRFVSGQSLAAQAPGREDTRASVSPSSLKAGLTGLERLPTSSLLRNLLIAGIFSSPLLFKPGLGFLNLIANSKLSFLNPDRNPILRAILKPLIYDQFCAGTNKAEIQASKQKIKSTGYSGIILCYGREVQVSSTNKLHCTGTADRDPAAEIEGWKTGNLQTLDMICDDDWLGIKLSGAGPTITDSLMCNREPSKEFLSAMDAICQKAQDKNCRIWIDAEQQVLQTAIDRWTIDLMRKYNRNGKVLVYNTIQAYLKASRAKLQHQLQLAKREGWTLAVKLVRGAYIANDQREKIHDTKQETDDSYNGIVQSILSGRDLGFLETESPKMELFLAGHNPESVARAWDSIQALAKAGQLKVTPDFGQLQGMADDLGCKVLQKADDLRTQQKPAATPQSDIVPRIYKCLTWGSIQECMQYLIRRVVENSGGTDRMRDGTSAYVRELRRRVF